MKLKPPIAKLLVLGAIGVVVAGVAVGLALRPAAPLEAVEITGDFQKLLDRHSIAELDLENAFLNQAIAVLNRSLAEPPETAAVRVALWTAPAPPPGFHRREPQVGPGATGVIPGLVDPIQPGIPAPPVRPEEASLSLRLTNVPFRDALRYVASLSGCVAGRMGDTIYLVPGQDGGGAFGPLIERTVTLPSGRGYGLPDDPEAAKEALRLSGVGLYEGFEVRRIAPKRLLIRGVKVEMDEMATMVDFDLTWRERLQYWLIGSWESLRSKLGSPTF